MIDWWRTFTRLQKEMLDASRASLDMGRQAQAAAEHMVAMQEAGQKAVEANLKLWESWASVWRMGR